MPVESKETKKQAEEFEEADACGVFLHIFLLYYLIFWNEF